MAIKNYSTSVDSYKTISEIQQLLAKKGARQINIKNDAKGNPISLSFLILWDAKPIAFMLPCNFEGIKRAMLNDRKIARNQCTVDQALRVGWRIVKDWVSAQLAIVEAEACTMPQVFLPYAVTKTGQTLYEQIDQNKAMLALPE
jgi:hypothetical protein